jgi:hypothetical protein
LMSTLFKVVPEPTIKHKHPVTLSRKEYEQ